MPIYIRSDVYWEERDLSQVAEQEGVSTGAIVAATKKGPIGRKYFTTVEQIITTYGIPDARVSYGVHSALAFLTQSNQLWFNRVVGAGSKYGTATLQQIQPSQVAGTELGALKLVPGSIANPDVNGIDWDKIGGTNNQQDNIMTFWCQGPGSYSQDISIAIESTNLVEPANVEANDFSTIGVIIAGVDTSGTLVAGNYSYKISALNRDGESLPSDEATVTLPGGVASYVTWDTQAGALGYNIYRKVDAVWLLLETVGAANSYYIDKGYATPVVDKEPATEAASTQEFTVDVYDASVSSSLPQETFVCTLQDYTNGNGEQLEITQLINNTSKLIKCATNLDGLLTVPTIYSVAKTALGVGDSGVAVTSSNVIMGWDEFQDDEIVDVNILINAGYSVPEVQQKMDAIAHTRGDAFAILDVPSLKQACDNALDYRNIELNLSSNRAALYTPDVFIQDPYSGKKLFIPPSGYAASIFAYTDRVTYPWFAPAGLNRGQLRVLDIRHKYNKGERDRLKKAKGINYIRSFQGLGNVVWEARTLQGFQSGFSFISVRRLMDAISKTTRKTVIWQDFEPNDDFTRSQIKNIIEMYLDSVKTHRGIKEYLVVVDDSNNPAYLTDQGQLLVDILIKPTLPIEIIRIRGTLTSQGAVFAELISQGILTQ